MSSLPVLVIHGFTTTNLSNLPIHYSLRKAGFRTYNVHLPGLNTQDIRHSSTLVAKRVKEIKQKHDCEKILLVGVSMGGIIGLHYLRKLNGHKHIEKFVALGSPFHGVEFAKFLEYFPALDDHAISQMASDSDLIKEITEGEFEQVNITSIGAVGDTMVPEPVFI